MNPDLKQLEARVIALENFKKSLEYSNTIPRNIETALRERLKNIVKNGVIFGTGALVGGKLDINDPRISSSSIGIAMRLNTSSNFSLARADLASGYISGNIWRFFESTLSETYEINYIILP